MAFSQASYFTNQFSATDSLQSDDLPILTSTRGMVTSIAPSENHPPPLAWKLRYNMVQWGFISLKPRFYRLVFTALTVYLAYPMHFFAQYSSFIIYMLFVYLLVLSLRLVDSLRNIKGVSRK